MRVSGGALRAALQIDIWWVGMVGVRSTKKNCLHRLILVPIGKTTDQHSKHAQFVRLTNCYTRLGYTFLLYPPLRLYLLLYPLPIGYYFLSSAGYLSKLENLPWSSHQPIILCSPFFESAHNILSFKVCLSALIFFGHQFTDSLFVPPPF